MLRTTDTGHWSHAFLFHHRHPGKYRDTDLTTLST